MLNLNNLSTISSLGKNSGNPWFKEGALKLNGVLPSLIHQYGNNRYYNTVDKQTPFPFSETRPTNATLFNRFGDLKWAPNQYAAATEDLTSASWAKAAGSGGIPTVTPGFTAPDGSATAWGLDCTDGNGRIANSAVSALTTLGGNVTFSFWGKTWPGDPDGTISSRLRKRDGVQAANVTISLTSDWQRFSYTQDLLTGTSQVLAYPIDGGQPGTLDRMLIWHPMISSGDEVYDYISNPNTASAKHGPRFDYNPATLQPRGYYIESQRTNSIRNNTLLGGVAGSPGTAPTNWSISAITGVTITTAYGVENGIPYIDITYSGTNTTGAVSYPTITPEISNNIVAASGQTWTASVFTKKIGGADSEANWNIGLVGRNSGGSIVSGESITADFSSATTLSAGRVQATKTLVDATVAFVQPRITRDILGIGESMDITIRIGLPQMELGAFASSVICTYGVASTRSGDVANLTTPPPYSASGTTYFAIFERQGTPVNSTGESSSGLWFFGTNGDTQVSAPFGFGTSNQIRVDLVNASVNQCALSDFADPFTVHTLCARISPNDARAAYDATLGTLDTTVTMPSSIPTTVMAIGRREAATHQMHGWLKEFRIYETAAPDSELIRITS